MPFFIKIAYQIHKSLVIPNTVFTRLSCFVINQYCSTTILYPYSGNMIQSFSYRCNIGISSRERWWRHQMETFSALLAICAGNSPVPGEFPTQRPVTRSFDVFFDLCLNKWFSKQRWGWWFETLSRPLWRNRNEIIASDSILWNAINFSCLRYLPLVSKSSYLDA